MSSTLSLLLFSETVNSDGLNKWELIAYLLIGVLAFIIIVYIVQSGTSKGDSKIANSSLKTVPE